MKYRFLLLLFVIAACKNKTTTVTDVKLVYIDSAHLLYPYNEPRINWKTVEKQNDLLKNAFIAHHPANFNDAYNGYMHPGEEKLFPAQPGKLKNAIHIIDCNGDGKDDIVYDGSGGWETNKVFVYINTPKGFKLVFWDKQYVKRLEFKDGRMWRMYTYNPGCCDDYMVFSKIFEFKYKGEPNDFKEIYSTGYYNTTLLPKIFLDKPLKFETIVDSVKLRTKPIVAPNDSLFLAGSIHMGNNVGTLAKGAKGRAIATKTDKQGVIWWLVEMEKKAEITGDVFYNEMSDNDYCGKMGWVDSTELKIVTQ